MKKVVLNNRIVKAALILCFGLGIAVAISLSLGAVPLSFQEIWLALLRQGNPVNQTILWDLRLPRTLAAMLVGAALGMSGALLQGMLRNGLADPFLLGISAGAGLAAVVLLMLGLFIAWVPLASWLGAILTTLAVYFLARTPLGISVQRLILGGVALSAFFGSITSMLLLFSDDRVQVALNWLIGSLNGRGWLEVKVVGLYISVGLIAGCLLARPLNLLSLGDELAVGLGVSLARSRLLIGGVAALLAAGAVSISGLIGFVGLVVPHIVRLLVGTNHYWVLPLSAVAGALLMTVADLIARLGSVELPVGVVTSVIGAPFFGFLLYRRSDIS
ncbi:MAG: iron ABC transporter permease [Oscillatoriales cyanobacterium]|nr:iron ABC transporter permease [Microcoleus sp. PH2017_05_CCC_O_A]MCC3583541.1 iron ABC transporter permease [Microcoleus sp. PH2017_30_WIL_O_A]TAG08082.1 MAG: iron ABC transporter permease [Oscillatoriales cyanobacterium]TAG17528.1 MAG: iron ABC transporter permease [Oscillatoriales cyanobacterium]TAG45643.1 MAG: iron ABC transporter permease [Oscillatoriales cyanobacterium]